jgi:hypothetical protein
MATPFFGDSDIPFMLDELGVPITAGGFNGFGILDLNDEVETFDGRGAAVIMKAITLVVQTSLFPHSAIATDATITVDGISYVVIKPLGQGDGALSKLLLRRGVGSGQLLGNLVRHSPNEALDGVRMSFAFTGMPADPALSVLVWNGMIESAGDDYTISGGVLTTVRAPAANDNFFLYY